MGAIVVLLMSFVTSFVFSGVSQNATLWLKPQSGRVLSTNHAYEPPLRKSIIVDTEGLEHPTADNTHPTRRDRSFKLPRPSPGASIKTDGKRAKAETPSELASKGSPADSADSENKSMQPPMIMSPMQMPGVPNMARQYQVEEAPLAPAGMPKNAPVVAAVPKTHFEQKPKVVSAKHRAVIKTSLGRRVKKAIQAHPEISRSAKLTLTVTSAKGKVILRGIVSSAGEKARIGVIAGRIAGVKKVRNQLIVVSKSSSR